MNYLKKIIIFFLIGISVNCKEIARINNNIRDDKNWLNMEIEKDEKIKILKTKQKLSLCLKEYNLSNFLVSNCSLLIDKDKIKEFTIKEDELKNYSDEIKNLVKQLDKKMYLSKGISVIPRITTTDLPETTFFNKKIIDSEVIIYLSKDFNYYLDLHEYEKMKKKMEKIDDFQDKLKKIEKVAEYIYSKKEEYESIVNFNSNFRIYSDLHKYLNFSNEVYFEDWFLDTYYYSLNEDLIKLYNLLENNKK
ncbi:hypothetical protein HMPREF3180_02297 [Leptotrichia wadei]|mgnify:CR=1 FL=1|jgi:hypothetical protein|uniref:Uncharacterized protein n=1 Tax=Leptotrichia wadei TaxID=157687 RepID=A0A133ZVT8_9FUSO|nr:hypothetical protein [Leptotrichia wadei]KXB59549.1 hypothetical protein HMPREF3180_02297 [Leptotrichia wadei]BBM43907.1 hypothetical protein JCM16777_p1020 [Leptotrichia wadei]